MIDYENQIYASIREKLKAQFDGIYTASEDVAQPPAFPAVSIVEIVNIPRERSADQDEAENHAELTYEVNVYSNKQSGKKAECRKIAKVVDERFALLNFQRIMLEPVANLNDSTIYRMVGRYHATVGQDGVIYRM